MTAVLTVAHASKRYCKSLRRSLWYGLKDVARELVPAGVRDTALRPGEFWAVDDVSFELARGESLAIMGRNGAGKTTLLKMLFGLLKPDRGEIHAHGRTEALIELGTGINPLLTGRENIRIGAALRGLDRREEEELRSQVIEFTELADFIDSPVQSYSTGMKARLAYAIAAHLQPDVLLVDEALAVGDFAFQRKCARHMRAYLDRGGSMLLVSHSPWQIQSLCERGILLDRGRVAFEGNAIETLNAMFELREHAEPSPAMSGGGPLRIRELSIERDEARTGEPLRIGVHYRAEEPVEIMWGFSIWTADQSICVVGEHYPSTRLLAPGDGELRCTIPRLPLIGGRYVLRASIVDPVTLLPFALIGWDGRGKVFDVRGHATNHAVSKMAINQLVTTDVDWT